MGVRDTGFAIGFRYGMDMGGADIGFGVGYQTFTTAAGYLPGNLSSALIGPFPAGDDVTIVGLSADVSTNGFSAGVQYSMWDNDTTVDFTHLGVGVGYTSGAFTVSANYGQYDGDAPGFWDVQGWGLAAAYDLGGGATINAGYGTSEYFGVDAGDTFSLGVAMSF